MTEDTFQPNWASAPGETICAILDIRGIPHASLQGSLSMRQSEVDKLLTGTLRISSELAKRLSHVLGSTPRFWIDREHQYRSSLRALELAAPEVARWTKSFPVAEMVKAGWLVKPASGVKAGELLEFFGVSSLAEWKATYQARLASTKFRTSESFENSIGATTAWIRRGEIIADEMDCGSFDKEGFRASLKGIKKLTTLPDPRQFVPLLRQECGRYGVAVVVTRTIPGCVASGATYLLDSGTALLLLSARFLSDDQFWFSFFHEAGHLILHPGEASVEEKGAERTVMEDEANTFAQDVILSPVGRDSLMALELNKFSIARFARKCDVASGLIIGQLQKKDKISHSSYNAMKVRYSAPDFSL